KTHYYINNESKAQAVDDVSFHVNQGETVCIVGESGCGKSATALSIMQLISPEQGEITSGSIILNGKELTQLSMKEMGHVRGKQMSMIFQEPMTSLNPVLKIGSQMVEHMVKHEKISKKEAVERAKQLLELVGFSNINEAINQYPHELSGGMRQRVMIAIAMACNPQLLIADEPTTALDVTTQSHVLDVIDTMKRTFNSSVLLITHDLGVVADVADRVIVMYAGQIVEETITSELFNEPKHPYTVALMKSMPTLNSDNERLYTIPGTVPPAHQLPKGCRFADRCSHTMDICKKINPDLLNTKDEHFV